MFGLRKLVVVVLLLLLLLLLLLKVHLQQHSEFIFSHFPHLLCFPAERRAQLARSRSRQDLLNLTGSTSVHDIDLSHSQIINDTGVAPPQERVRRPPKNKAEIESEAEQLLARLKEL